MALLASLAFLIGMALSLHFNFVVLLPVAGLAMVSVAGVEVARGEGIGFVPLTIVVTALQSGYLAGIVAQAIVASYAHASKRFHRHSQAS